MIELNFTEKQTKMLAYLQNVEHFILKSPALEIAVLETIEFGKMLGY